MQLYGDKQFHIELVIFRKQDSISFLNILRISSNLNKLCQKSCSVSKETVIRGTVWSEKLALLHAFVFEFRGNNTYIIQDRTALAKS